MLQNIHLPGKINRSLKEKLTTPSEEKSRKWLEILDCFKLKFLYREFWPNPSNGIEQTLSHLFEFPRNKQKRGN